MIDPVELQVLTGALRAVCEEMGAVLIRSAHSANIKERRDASTALFDARGRMVMQAEHIPVHLGAMPAAVEAVLGLEHAPGRCWILNDPYQGGTHLPDITVIEPVFAGGGGGGARRGASPRPLLDPQRSLPGRHAPSRHHRDHAGVRPPGPWVAGAPRGECRVFSRRRADRVRRQPRAPC